MQHEPPITCCAVIPARGGSKGIPGKNLKRIAGQPLIAHSIHAAKRAKHVQRVIVSTDDPSIAEVAREHGAEVVLRPPELATDSASSESALLQVLEQLEDTAIRALSVAELHAYVTAAGGRLVCVLPAPGGAERQVVL